jgi:hypothetical protein
MRLFVVLSPVMSGRRPGDLVTGDQVGDDAAMDRAVAAGIYTEVFFDAPADAPVVEYTDEHPARNASRVVWAEFAEARGLDVDDLTRDEIVALFLDDSDD